MSKTSSLSTFFRQLPNGNGSKRLKGSRKPRGSKLSIKPTRVKLRAEHPEWSNARVLAEAEKDRYFKGRPDGAWRHKTVKALPLVRTLLAGGHTFREIRATTGLSFENITKIKKMTEEEVAAVKAKYKKMGVI